MIVRSIELLHVAVPLRTKIRHASHERTVSDNLVVRATLDSGHVGHGEGVPRSYVTGETIETAFDALRRFDAARAVGSPSDFEDAARRVGSIGLPEIAADPRGMFGNAARCALEIALLDAYGRAFGRSVGEAVPMLAGPDLKLHAAPVPVFYSGAITSASPRKEAISALKMRLNHFPHVKVKVGVPGQDDPARLRRFRRLLGRHRDIRIDANEAWTAAVLVERAGALAKVSWVSALEQPVPHAEVAALADLRSSVPIPIMLDESLCGVPDAEAAIRDDTASMFNVRLSKCGGFAPSLRIAGMARGAGLGVQLGCHPGETGLLSAAGRHFATRVAGLRFAEGSYDRHVLAENVIVEDITFGYRGKARPLTGPGLGVTVDPEALERLTARREEVRFG